MNRYARQPSFANPITRGPLARGLVLATLFNGGNTFREGTGVAGEAVFIHSLTSFLHGVNKFGSYVELNAVGLNERIRWDRSDFVPGSGGMTVSMLYEKADATNRASLAWSVSYGLAGVGYACHAAVPWSDGIVYLQFGNSQLSASSLSFGADHWVFSVGPRGMEIWQNGIKQASNGTNPTRTTDGAQNFLLGGSDAAGFVFADLARYNKLCMWNRQLETREILDLAVNPYAPWEIVNPMDRAVRAALALGEDTGAGHPVGKITQLMPYALPGRRYGSFAGRSSGGFRPFFLDDTNIILKPGRAE